MVVLIDVPDQAFTDDFSKSCHQLASTCWQSCPKGAVSSALHPDTGDCECAVSALERFISLKEIQHLVVTHLTPKHVTSIKTFLNKRNDGGDASQLQITLSNPARQVLMSTMGTVTSLMTGTTQSCTTFLAVLLH